MANLGRLAIMIRDRYHFLLALLGSLPLSISAQNMQLELNFWRPNGSVFAIAVDSAANVVFIGGDFTALTDPQPPFTSVARNHIAAMDLATGALLPWAPDVDGQVVCLATTATTVYVGGSFGYINGQLRTGLGSINRSNGQVTAWNPAAGSFAMMRTMTIAGGRLFVGGIFNGMSGSVRTNAAAFDVATGMLTSWDPAPNDYVVTLRASGSTMYLGGHFTTVGGQPRERLAAVDINSSAVGAWAPNPSGPVRGLALGGGTLYVVGDFTTIAGEGRNYAAAFNGGALTSWNPNPDQPVVDIGVGSAGVVLAGYFNTINGTSRSYMAAVDAGGTLTSWDPHLSGNVWALAASGPRMFAVGSFGSSMYFNTVPNFASFVPEPPAVTVRVRAILEGPYVSGTALMHDSLRNDGLLPFTEPYTALGYAHTSAGTHPMASTDCSSYGAVYPPNFTSSGSSAYVDWVVLELRDATDPAVVVASKRALLQRSAEVRDINGQFPRFPVPAGSYHVAIRHRNHLGAMSATPVALSGTSATLVNFTGTGFTTYGTNARKQVGSVMCLWTGDATGEGAIKYTGLNNDRDPILVAVGSSTPNSSISGQYRREDVNLDGQVKYTGLNNDRDPILVNVGSGTPNATRIQQIP